MKFKLLLQLGFLATAFTGLVQAGGKKLTDANKTNLFENYKKLDSYKKLSPEIKDFIDQNLWKKIQLPNGNTYVLRITNKGANRLNELVLRCNKSFLDQGKRVTEIFTIPSLLKNDNQFRTWFQGQGLNVPLVQKTTSVDYLKAAEYTKSQQALYKKVLDGLELKQAMKSYASSLKGEQQAARAYSTAWQNYVAQSANSSSSSNVGNAAFLGSKTGTSVFSVKADNLSTSVKNPITGAFQKGAEIIGQSTKYCPDFSVYQNFVNRRLNKQVAKAALPFVALVGATSVGTGLASYMQPVSQPVEEKPANQEFDNKHTRFADKINAKSYFQMAQNGISSAYSTVTTTASDIYKNATLENMQKGISTVGTKANENRLATAGIVAGTVALGYGAYKLYNTDFSVKAKQTSTPVKTPVKAKVKRPMVVRPRSPLCGRA